MSGFNDLRDNNHAQPSVTTLTVEQQRKAGVHVAGRALAEGWDRSLLTEQLDMLGLLDPTLTEVAR